MFFFSTNAVNPVSCLLAQNPRFRKLCPSQGLRACFERNLDCKREKFLKYLKWACSGEEDQLSFSFLASIRSPFKGFSRLGFSRYV